MDYSFANGLVALAGGGQTGATPIGAASGSGGATYNRFTTVANANDSCILPAAAPGLRYEIYNKGAQSLNVFPAVGDAINALSANTAFALATTKSAVFTCMVRGTWDTLPIAP